MELAKGDGNRHTNLKKSKIVKTQSILTILFASLLCFNKHERTAAAAEQKSTCGLRYHGSCYGPKNSNLIEKKVSEQTVTARRRD